MTKDEIQNGLRRVYPFASDAFLDARASALAAIVPELKVNLEEWLSGKPLSQVWVRDTYCLQTVLRLRGGGDIGGALLALDAYAKDAAKESGMYRWRR